LWLLSACGSAPESPAAQTEQAFYVAIARGDVRYALLTESEKTVEARTAGGELMRLHGVEDLGALAAVLSKEHVEYYMQETRSAQMPE
jgi:hypothetical protein